MSKIVRCIIDALEGLLSFLLIPRRSCPQATHTVVGADGAHRAATSGWLARRTLQLAVFVAAAVPVGTGAWGVIHTLDPPASGLASHERYLSGLLLAVGLAFWTTVPDIVHKTARFRLLAALVVTGGLCRLAGVATGDMLTGPTIGALCMELVVTPLLCVWQGNWRALGTSHMPTVGQARD